MRRDQIIQSARGTPFDNTNQSIRGFSLQEAVEELRKQTVHDPEYTTISLNGFLNLTTASSSLHFLTGSATGFSVKFPDATQLFKGQVYIVVNQSSASISIRDFNNNFLFEVLSESIATVFLQSNSTSSGIWTGYTVSGFATGIISYNLTSQTPFTTSSLTDVLITGFSITPIAGRYGVWYSADIEIVTNNRIADCTIYRAGTIVSDTNREVQGTGSKFQTSQQTLGIISVNGSQTVDIRVASSGGNIIIGNRSLLLIRLGPP